MCGEEVTRKSAEFAGFLEILRGQETHLCRVKKNEPSARFRFNRARRRVEKTANRFRWFTGNLGRRKSAGQSDLALAREGQRKTIIIAAVRQRARSTARRLSSASADEAMSRAGHVVMRARAQVIHRHRAAVTADLPESRRLQPWPVAAIVAQLLAPMV